MWRCEGVSLWRCEDVKMWRWADVKMWRCEGKKMWGCEDVKMWGCEDVKMSRCEDVKMWRCEGKKMWRCEGVSLWRCEDVKMRRWEDVKMYNKPPLSEEPFAQTLSGKTLKQNKFGSRTWPSWPCFQKRWHHARSSWAEQKASAMARESARWIVANLRVQSLKPRSQTVYTTLYNLYTIWVLCIVLPFKGWRLQRLQRFPPTWRAAQLGRFPSAPNRLPRSRLLIRPLVHPSGLPHDVRVLLVVVRRPGFRGWHPRESTHLHTSSHIFSYLHTSSHTFVFSKLQECNFS